MHLRAVCLSLVLAAGCGAPESPDASVEADGGVPVDSGGLSVPDASSIVDASTTPDAGPVDVTVDPPDPWTCGDAPELSTVSQGAQALTATFGNTTYAIGTFTERRGSPMVTVLERDGAALAVSQLALSGELPVQIGGLFVDATHLLLVGRDAEATDSTTGLYTVERASGVGRRVATAPRGSVGSGVSLGDGRWALSNLASIVTVAWSGGDLAVLGVTSVRLPDASSGFLRALRLVGYDPSDDTIYAALDSVDDLGLSARTIGRVSLSVGGEWAPPPGHPEAVASLGPAPTFFAQWDVERTRLLVTLDVEVESPFGGDLQVEPVSYRYEPGTGWTELGAPLPPVGDFLSGMLSIAVDGTVELGRRVRGAEPFALDFIPVADPPATSSEHAATESPTLALMDFSVVQPFVRDADDVGVMLYQVSGSVAYVGTIDAGGRVHRSSADPIPVDRGTVAMWDPSSSRTALIDVLGQRAHFVADSGVVETATLAGGPSGGLSEFGVTFGGTRLFLAGGQRGEETSREVWVFDLATRAWSRLPDRTTSGSNPLLRVDGTTLIALGGYESGSVTTCAGLGTYETLDLLAPTSWQTRTASGDVPDGDASELCPAFVIGRRVYADTTAGVAALDLATDTWATCGRTRFRRRAWGVRSDGAELVGPHFGRGSADVQWALARTR